MKKLEAVLHDELHDELVTLGETADEIAKALKAYGVTGYRRNPTDGPIASHLWAVLTAEGFRRVRVSVNEDLIRVETDGCQIDFPTPPAVQEFIRRFDAGAYPELDAATE